VLRSYEDDFKAAVVEQSRLPSKSIIMKQQQAMLHYGFQPSAFGEKTPFSVPSNPMKPYSNKPLFDNPVRMISDIADLRVSQLNMERQPAQQILARDLGAAHSPSGQRERFRRHLP